MEKKLKLRSVIDLTDNPEFEEAIRKLKEKSLRPVAVEQTRINAISGERVNPRPFLRGFQPQR